MRTLWPMLLPGLLIPGCTVVTARTLPAPSHASTADMPTAAETLTESVSVPVLQRLEAIPGDTGGTVARWQLVAEAADRERIADEQHARSLRVFDGSLVEFPALAVGMQPRICLDGRFGGEGMECN